MKPLVRTIFAVALAALLGLYKAFIALKFWAWFVVPAFGLHAPPLFVSWGLCLLVTLVTCQFKAPPEDAAKESLLGQVLFIFFSLSFVWAFGGIAHWMAS